MTETSLELPAVVTSDAQLQISLAWLTLLPDPVDRNRFALQPYRMHHDLAEQLDALQPAREPVAAAAALILSGYVWTQPAPLPTRVEVDGLPVLRRHDRAVAWRYPLAGGQQFLYYWQPAYGPIVLARFAGVDHTALPGVDTTARVIPPNPSPVEPPPAPAPTDEPVDVPAATAPAGRVALAVDDVALVNALRGADSPLYATELRGLLGIPEEVSRGRFGKVLNDAIDRGLIVRVGQRRGARYTTPD